MIYACWEAADCLAANQPILCLAARTFFVSHNYLHPDEYCQAWNNRQGREFGSVAVIDKKKIIKNNKKNKTSWWAYHHCSCWRLSIDSLQQLQWWQVILPMAFFFFFILNGAVLVWLAAKLDLDETNDFTWRTFHTVMMYAYCKPLCWSTSLVQGCYCYIWWWY